MIDNNVNKRAWLIMSLCGIYALTTVVLASATTTNHSAINECHQQCHCNRTSASVKCSNVDLHALDSPLFVPHDTETVDISFNRTMGKWLKELRWGYAKHVDSDNMRSNKLKNIRVSGSEDRTMVDRYEYPRKFLVEDELHWPILEDTDSGIASVEYQRSASMYGIWDNVEMTKPCKGCIELSEFTISHFDNFYHTNTQFTMDLSHKNLTRIGDIGFNTHIVKLSYFHVQLIYNLLGNEHGSNNITDIQTLELFYFQSRKKRSVHAEIATLDLSNNPQIDLSLYPLIDNSNHDSNDSLCVIGVFGTTCYGPKFTFDLPITSVQALTDISIANCNLSAIPDAFFKPMKKLKRLDLHGNLLHDLHLKMESDHLEHVDLSDNRLSLFPDFLQHKVHEGEPQSVSQQHPVPLRTSLAHTITLNESALITSLNESARLQDQLLSINMSGNSLSAFDPSLLCERSSLKWLDLSRNNISSIQHVTSKCVLTYLKGLYLASNRIQVIPLFNWSPNLHLVDVSYNQIELIDNTKDYWQHTPHLQAISLSHNPIRYLHAITFRHLTELLTLNLASCHIKWIHDEAFRDLTNLRSLNLSHNRITELGRSLLALISLTELDMQHNFLIHFLAIHLPKPLINLDLSNNNIFRMELAGSQRLRQLRHLNLRSNTISAITRGMFPGSVQTLNLGNNLLREFKSSLIDGHIVELILRHNLLISISPDLLNKTEILDISWNQLTSFAGWKELPGTVTALQLAGDHWLCDCRHGPRTHQFVMKYADVIEDEFKMACKQNDTHTSNMTNISHLVITSMYTTCSTASSPFFYISVSLIPVLVILFMIYICIHHNERVAFYVYLYTGCRISRPSRLHRSYPYDVFLNYSRSDQDIHLMRHLLLPLLDQQYKTYIPDRDWPAGDDCFQVIEESIKQSRTVVLLISEAFCEDAHCMYTFKQTVAAEKTEASTRMLLVLLEQNIPNMEPLMKQYVTRNRCLALEDPKFQKKLFYRLPKPGSNHAAPVEMDTLL